MLMTLLHAIKNIRCLEEERSTIFFKKTANLKGRHGTICTQSIVLVGVGQPLNFYLLHIVNRTI